MQCLSLDSTKMVSGGSFELEYDTGWREGMGSQNPLEGVSIGLSFGVGIFSIGFEIGSCGSGGTRDAVPQTLN